MSVAGEAMGGVVAEVDGAVVVVVVAAPTLVSECSLHDIVYNPFRAAALSLLLTPTFAVSQMHHADSRLLIML